VLPETTATELRRTVSAAIDRELALEGLLVIDLSAAMGAYGTKLLADFGADVIKVEPHGGDYLRQVPPFATGGARESLVFSYYNANKRGVALDFGDPKVTDALAALAQGADLVVAAIDPALPVPGYDPERRTLSWADPGSIICLLSGFGTDGPYAGYRTTNLTAFAASGQMHSLGPADEPPRALPGFALYDELSAHAAAAAMAALHEREAAGPQTIELSLHDLLAYRGAATTASYEKSGEVIVRGSFAAGAPSFSAAAPPTGVWELKDGRVELLIFNAAHWDGFVALMGNPAALTDPALTDSNVRLERAPELIEVISGLFAQRTLNEVLDAATRCRVPCAPQYVPPRVILDAQFASRGYWVTQDGPGTGPFRVPGLPFRASVGLLAQHRRPAPLLGQHNEELLAPGRPAAPKRAQSRTWTPSLPRLADLNVLSFGTAIAGNVSATMLSELGADVVKIEARDRPEPLRHGPISPLLPRVFEPEGAETNIHFASYSRSCRSIALNMKDPGDQATFLELAKRADVLIDNFATGVMDRWGLPLSRVAETNPRLIMITVSGYGRTGPRARSMAFGSTINSFMGLTRIWSPHGTQFDFTAVSAVLPAVFGALAYRARHGVGTIIDLAQHEVGAAMFAPLYLGALQGDDDSWPRPNEVPGSAFTAVVACSGADQWLAVEARNADEWDNLARLVERPDLISAAGGAVGDEPGWQLHRSTAAWASQLAPATAERLAQRGGVPALWVRTAADQWEDPQLWARDAFVKLHHQDLGTFTNVIPFQRFSRTPVAIRHPSARLGEHTGSVIAEWLGDGR
jgi:crotonobetainyl-CoA:carnitine CoA-transferase CaiB-like acyl-CoA transferase